MTASSNIPSGAGPHSEKAFESPGHPERPIERASEDVLGQMNFVRRLADALIDKSTEKSRGIAIGVTGIWGSGKSSVLNLLRQHIPSILVHLVLRDGSCSMLMAASALLTSSRSSSTSR